MKHLGLFEGIGGFSLAARWMGWETVAWVEINEFCQKVLKKNFPEAKGYGDIKEFDGTPYRGTIDILTGGFPCKQTSVGASIHGYRNGLEGRDSSLWYELHRVIGEILPRWAVVENVAGVKKWENIIQGGLEESGYAVSRLDQKASFYGLPHSRRRSIYVANRDSQGLSFTRQSESPTTEWIERLALNGGSWLYRTPGTGRGINGIPNRVDRIKSLGNAIVPQVAFEIFKAIEQVKSWQQEQALTTVQINT